MAVVRFVIRADEMQQRIHGIGALIGLVFTVAVCFTYGFLESYADFPALKSLWIGIIGIVSWSFGSMLVTRWYR